MEDGKKIIRSEFTTYSKSSERYDRTEESGVPDAYKKLLRNGVIVAALLLGVWGIKNIEGLPAATVSEAASSELAEEEDLGRLKFVNGEFSLPMDGEVVETFAESERDVSIEGSEQARVNSILSGTVVETGESSVVINNINGTRTTYTGLAPAVKAGDEVKSAEQIGQLTESVLTVETVSSIGYIDPLSHEEMLDIEQ